MEKSNKIIFKLKEYYNNDKSKELMRFAAGVSGKLNISAINLLNNYDTSIIADVTKEEPYDLSVKVAELTKDSVSADQGFVRVVGDNILTEERLPNDFRGVSITINDTTENIFSVGFITNNEGYGKVDLSKMLTNPTFIKFYQKYKGQITLNITIEIPKTEKYKVFVGNVKITPSWYGEKGEIIFESYNYYDKNGSIVLSPIENTVTNLAMLRQVYKTVEDNYLLVKKQYESQISGEVNLEIDTLETYEPKSFKAVITRLLEFQVGTLQPALDYTKTTKLTIEYDRLNIMNKLISILCKMYPKITIEDGEGMPYNSGIDVKSEAS